VQPSVVIEVRPFDPATDADGVAQAIVDSSNWHVGLEPERYRVHARATAHTRSSTTTR
jgi:hypothetical protein